MILPEFRADVVKEWIGPARFARVAEDHQRETAQIRQRRKDSMLEGKDFTLMPTSLAEARARALRVSQEAKEAGLEFTLPRLVLAQSPRKRTLGQDKRCRPRKVPLFEGPSSPPCKRPKRDCDIVWV